MCANTYKIITVVSPSFIHQQLLVNGSLLCVNYQTKEVDKSTSEVNTATQDTGEKCCITFITVLVNYILPLRVIIEVILPALLAIVH